MNILLLIFFVILQVVVNWVVGMFIPTTTIYGLLAFYLLTSIIMGFILAFITTPAGYKKDFYKHPAFHKTMLTYFAIFLIFDLVMIGFNYLW